MFISTSGIWHSFSSGQAREISSKTQFFRQKTMQYADSVFLDGQIAIKLKAIKSEK
jgi:hypothetical protein